MDEVIQFVEFAFESVHRKKNMEHHLERFLNKEPAAIWMPEENRDKVLL